MNSPMSGPWDDWIPGVLNKRQMLDLSDLGLLKYTTGVVKEASLDLSLSREAYRMKEGSVKPSGHLSYGVQLNNPALAEAFEPDSQGVFTFKPLNTYVIKIEQRLTPRLAEIGIWGQATAKSSVGRVDVLARLIVDGMDQYEYFDADPKRYLSGDMYLEVTPFTFCVKVRVKDRLSQLRFFYGNPKDVEIRGKQIFRTVFKGSDSDDGSLSVDLSNTIIGELPVAAFCADSQGDTADPICLWDSKDLADPCKTWKFRTPSEPGCRLKIEQNKFYILRSKEKISVPEGIAIYCRATDETIGEMRIHYAGFVHPHFGHNRGDGEQGTPLIFEVRGHQMDVSLSHGERMANLTLYRMSKNAEPDKSPYEDQTLKLSSFFSSWPEKLRKVDDEGTVESKVV